MSGASGAESAESDAPVARRLRPRREFKRDVNFVEENKNLDDYEQLSSGESDGNAIADIDDDNVEPRGMDEAEYVISATDALELDEAFIASLSIGDNVKLSPEALARRQDALRSMYWTQPSSNFEIADGYPGLTAEEARPVAELQSLCDSPLDTFFYFAPKSMWIDIC
ncbi:hypothetical protein PHPALM_27571 [Phytophthora palmivora]|uniref:Uncharacterized protein n=1 Tax=Phytophthora palmivora TaxID=4796 RepID=A0A2P4XC89_9STRA|nr:hypothetical protein PHPALM_27571 [Phytophthora palmivora]